MKKPFILTVLGVLALFLIIFFASQDTDISGHPTLNTEAALPDQYLKNVKYYEEAERHEASAYSLTKAIESILSLEEDVDTESFEKLEAAVNSLEELHRSILLDSVNSIELEITFERVMNNLAHAELEIAEMYAETDKMKQANIALKYARLHIKNAMLFHTPFWEGDSVVLAIEKQVFDEMDKLLADESASPMEFSMKIDELIKEVDKLIEK